MFFCFTTDRLGKFSTHLWAATSALQKKKKNDSHIE